MTALSIPERAREMLFDLQVWWYGFRHRKELSKRTVTDATSSVRSLLSDEPATKEIHEVFKLLDKIDARDGGQK